MTQYVGCEQARELLDGLVDGELSMVEQLAVESHLRWCRTCALRVEDMHLIGASLRLGATGDATRRLGDEAAVSAVNDALLLRVRAEREQSFGFRAREMFTDMRFLWPALAATAAVAVCASVAASVLQASAAERPESLAAMIATLANPGSERNPLRPGNTGDPLRDEGLGVSIPRLHADDARRAGGTLEEMPEEDVIYTIRTVVSRDGRISNFEVLLSGEPNVAAREHARHDRAVLDAVRQTRFAPAQTPLGEAVAVDMVWVIAKTTAVVAPAVSYATPAIDKRPQKDSPKPNTEDPAAVTPNQRSATLRHSTTA